MSRLVNRRFAAVAAVALLSACTRDLPTSASDLSVRDGKNTAGGGTSGTTGPVVSAASPNLSKRDTTINVRILGSGFDRTMTAKWGIAGVATSDVIVNSTRYVSTSELVANVTVTGNAELTKYDIIVTSTKTGKPGIGTEKFEVVIELPLPSLGGTYSGASAINDAGVIAGWSTYKGSGTERAVIWENGVVRDLMPATGYMWARAYDINSSGVVAGIAATTAGIFVPFVWSPSSGFRELPRFPGATESGATAINDAGVVAGYSDRSAVIWVNGVLQEIYNVLNQTADAWGINSQGEVVGHYYQTVNGPAHAFIWRPGSGAELLHTLDGSLGTVADINDAGQGVGSGPLPGDTTAYAFIIENGVARRIVTSASGASSAVAISEYGDVVGGDSEGRTLLWSADGTETVLCRPVVYRGGSSRCGVGGVNSDGVAVGVKEDPYGASYAYKWMQLMLLPQ